MDGKEGVGDEPGEEGAVDNGGEQDRGVYD